jgi:hypothetical protein
MRNSLEAELQIASAQSLIIKPERIHSATSATREGEAYVVWHQVPEDDPEAVFVAAVNNNSVRSNPRYVAEGADPDCLILDDEVWVSWVIKDFSDNSHTINVSIFDKELNSISTKTVGTEVRALFGRPYLVQYENQPILIYSTHRNQDHPQLHTCFIRSENTVITDVLSKSSVDLIVKYSGDVIAVIEGSDQMQVLAFNGRDWNLLTSIIIEAEFPHRFDFALNDQTAMFVMTLENSRVATLPVRLADGSVGDKKWAICEYGKFASIAWLNDLWVTSWVGAPALPFEDQGKRYNKQNMVEYAKVMIEISGEVESTERTEGVKRIRSVIEDIFGRSFVGPWAPLWLGVLDHGGRCIRSYGPLGSPGDENWNTNISSAGNNGVLLWRSYERCNDSGGPQDCFLNVREIQR